MSSGGERARVLGHRRALARLAPGVGVVERTQEVEGGEAPEAAQGAEPRLGVRAETGSRL